MRIALFSFGSCIAAQIAASDLPAGSTWAADARSGAMARPYWTDSANWNLFNAAGHSSVLPGAKGAPLQLRLGTSGIGADNSYATMSQSEVAAFQLRGVIENKAGSQWSLAVYNHLAQTYGAITPDAARKGLEIYAEHTEDARQHPGKHPNIDRLIVVAEEKKTLRVKHVFAV